MNETIFWWDGTVLSSGVIALVIFAPSLGPDDPFPIPVMGAAASGGTTVLVTSGQFGLFLRVHEERSLVCWNAADLHWSLMGALWNSHDRDSMECLWRFSRDARLIDLKFLDWHVRRFDDPLAAASPSFSAVAARVVNEETPSDNDLLDCILRASASASDASDTQAYLPAGRLVNTMRRLYGQLTTRAREALASVVRDLATISTAPIDGERHR
jgi:hypothetical protein